MSIFRYGETDNSGIPGYALVCRADIYGLVSQGDGILVLNVVINPVIFQFPRRSGTGFGRVLLPEDIICF